MVIPAILAQYAQLHVSQPVVYSALGTYPRCAQWRLLHLLLHTACLLLHPRQRLLAEGTAGCSCAPVPQELPASTSSVVGTALLAMLPASCVGAVPEPSSI